MTAIAPPPLPREELLAERLQELRAEREQALAEIVPAWSGDDADRATNVEGHVRLAMIESRIVAIETELEELRHQPPAPSDVVEPGGVVTLDLGDGPESFLLGSVDEAGAGVDVVTPGSPLGRALIGAAVGSTVSYSPRRGRTLEAKVLAIA